MINNQCSINKPSFSISNTKITDNERIECKNLSLLELAYYVKNNIIDDAEISYCLNYGFNIKEKIEQYNYKPIYSCLSDNSSLILETNNEICRNLILYLVEENLISPNKDIPEKFILSLYYDDKGYQLFKKINNPNIRRKTIKNNIICEIIEPIFTCNNPKIKLEEFAILIKTMFNVRNMDPLIKYNIIKTVNYKAIEYSTKIFEKYSIAEKIIDILIDNGFTPNLSIQDINLLGKERTDYYYLALNNIYQETDIGKKKYKKNLLIRFINFMINFFYIDSTKG